VCKVLKSILLLKTLEIFTVNKDRIRNSEDVEIKTRQQKVVTKNCMKKWKNTPSESPSGEEKCLEFRSSVSVSCNYFAARLIFLQSLQIKYLLLVSLYVSYILTLSCFKNVFLKS
jgi:hypothetical protein